MTGTAGEHHVTEVGREQPGELRMRHGDKGLAPWGVCKVHVSVWVPHWGQRSEGRSWMHKRFEDEGATGRRSRRGPTACCLQPQHLATSSIQGLDTEEGSAATAAEEAEVPIGTAGEVEADTVRTGGPTLSTSTQHPGEGVTLVRTV